MHSETFISLTHREISKKCVPEISKKLCYLRSCWYRDLTGFLTIKTIREKIGTLCTATWKEKTPETSYLEMNTTLRFAVERSLLQIDSYGHHVYD